MINIENNVIIIPPGNVRKEYSASLHRENHRVYPRRRLIIAIVT